MFYSLHSTTKEERDLLLGQEGTLISIDPQSFHGIPGHKAIVCEEGTGIYYEHDIKDFHDVLREIEKDPKYDYTQSAYFKRWIQNGSDIHTRLSNLPKLFADIKENGIQRPVECEVTGERLDGSYRTKIALFLGLKTVPAILHRFKWQDVSESFIERKLNTRWLSSGKDYYEFEYGYKDWKNVVEGGEVYRENAERADMIVDLIKGKTVLDIGCNEGYISIKAAMKGHIVAGIDLDLIHVAWLNKLIFEWINKKDLNIRFIEEDACKTMITADTILMLNVLYHLPREAQIRLLKQFKGKQMIFQCNLRKEKERDTYYTSHPDDLSELLTSLKIKHEVIEYKDKPIIITC